MALILAAPASGKTRFVRRQNADRIVPIFADGDALIDIPSERPDPSAWTANERDLHMVGFQSYVLNNPGMICIAFSEVCIDAFDTRGIPTVVVEVPEKDHDEYVECRHRNLRSGCTLRPKEFYKSQRIYLRQLAASHGLRIYNSFTSAVIGVKDMMNFVSSVSNTSNINNTIAKNGFCIVPNFLSIEVLQELTMKRSALYKANTKLSNHLTTSSTTGLSSIPLKDTIHQYLNPHLYTDQNYTTYHVAKEHILSFMDTLLGVEAGEHAYLFNDTLLTKTNEHNHRLHWHQVSENTCYLNA